MTEVHPYERGNAPLSAQSSGSVTESQPYYVFNAADNAGFIIISGDTRAKKILGYSDKGTYDANNMPPQLSAILKTYEDKLNSLAVIESTDPSWIQTATVSDNGILLKTANWGQDSPFNLRCPLIDDSRSLTGRVATAMAIVMKYNSWPDTYNWNSMPEENVTEDNSTEIARLMLDAGESVFMSYGTSLSGANMNWVG